MKKSVLQYCVFATLILIKTPAVSAQRPENVNIDTATVPSDGINYRESEAYQTSTHKQSESNKNRKAGKVNRPDYRQRREHKPQGDGNNKYSKNGGCKREKDHSSGSHKKALNSCNKSLGITPKANSRCWS